MMASMEPQLEGCGKLTEVYLLRHLDTGFNGAAT